MKPPPTIPIFRTGKGNPNPKKTIKYRFPNFCLGLLYICVYTYIYIYILYIYDNMKVIGDHIPKIFQLPSSQVDVRAMELRKAVVGKCREGLILEIALKGITV